MRTAGIFSDVAADAADGLRRRVRCVEVFVVLDASGNVEIDDSRFDDYASVREINFEDAIHTREADDDAVFDGQRAAAQASAGAACDKGNFFAVTDLDDCLHLSGGGGQYDRTRHDAKIGQTIALVSVKFFGRGDQAAAVDDRPELIKKARIHRFHSMEWKKKLATSVNEVQPIRDKLREDVGVHHDDDADDSRKGHGVPENKAEDGAFVANLVGGGGGDADGLSVNHFAHDAAGAIGGAHQNGAKVELLRGDLLQTAEQSV